MHVAHLMHYLYRIIDKQWLLLKCHFFCFCCIEWYTHTHITFVRSTSIFKSSYLFFLSKLKIVLFFYLKTVVKMASAPSTSSGHSAATATPINHEFPEPSAPSIDMLSSDKETTNATTSNDTTANNNSSSSSSTNTDTQMPNLDKDSKNKDSGDKKDESVFECNICLDTAKDAVVSLCGHLFCWPCLHQWLETRPTRQLCPVCKAAISKDKVIPLYGRGSTKEDPRYVWMWCNESWEWM